MTIVLHPEELLERDRAELTDSERALVDAHLAACIECRVLIRARGDFRAERELTTGPEPRVNLLPPEFVEQLEQQAEQARRRRASVRPAKRAFKYLPFVAAAVLAAGAAAAAAGAIPGLSSSHTSDPVRGGASLAQSAIAAHVRALHGSRRAPKASSEAPPAASETESRTQAQEPPSGEQRGPIRPEPARGTRPPPTSPPSVPVVATANAASAGALPDTPSSAPKSETSAPAAEPAVLFDRAAAARTRGDYTRALGLYRELEQRFPSSDEARVSRAIVARLMLDTGRSEAALADYSRYLAEKPAALTEEALVGRALAFQRLGRTRDERAAWRALLERYPSSVHAARARARLAATRDASP